MKFPTRRFFKRLAIGVTIGAAVVLLANGFMAWRTERQWQTLIDNLHAEGAPASLAELAPKQIPPDKNVAVLLQQAVNELRQFNEKLVQFSETPAGKSYDDSHENVLWNSYPLPNAEQAAAMKAILGKYPTILPLIDEAAARDEYASLSNFSLPPSEFLARGLDAIQELRQVGRFLNWQMTVSAAEGNGKEAVRLGTRMLRITRMCNQEPTLVSFLVTTAIRNQTLAALNDAVRIKNVSPQARQELDAELIKNDSMEALKQGLLTEEAFALSYMREQTDWVIAAIRWPMLKFFSGEFDDLIQARQIAKLSIDQIHFKWNSASKSHELDQGMAPKGRLLFAAIAATFSANVRTLANVRCLRVLNALEAYHDRSGQDATDLGQLGIPLEATVDPIFAKPLLFKHTDQGWIVYTVNGQGVDNGGIPQQDGSEGFAPAGYQAAKPATP